MLKKIINKMTKEFEEYTNELMSLEKSKIIEHFYKYTIKNEFFEIFKDAYYNNYTLCLNDDNLKFLSTLQHPLDFLYCEWLSTDTSLGFELHCPLNDFLQYISEF